MDPSQGIDVLLHQMNTGDRDARQAVMEHFYTPMRKLARVLLRQEAVGCSIESRELVNQTFVTKFTDKTPTLRSPGDFMAFAAYAMRQVVIDRGRRRATRRRYCQSTRPDSNRPIPPEVELAVKSEFRQLSALDPMAARLVECRNLREMTWEQTAETVGLPIRTARDRHEWALAWLRRRLKK